MSKVLSPRATRRVTVLLTPPTLANQRSSFESFTPLPSKARITSPAARPAESAAPPGSTFIRSLDRGATWSTGISWSGNGKKPQWNDKPWLAISRDGQHVYLGFNSSDSYFVYSHDFGVSFSTPVKTNSDTRYWFHSGGVVSPSNPMVAYFATSNYSNGNNYAGDSNVEILKTVDGGATWTDTHIDTSREVPACPWAAGCQQGFLGTQAALAMDRSAPSW